VVVDAGNGIAGSFAPELLRRLGAEVVELFCESAGHCTHHLPDPEMEENTRDLVAKVLETGADIGLAYDGDADRVGVVDERGRRHEADLILALLARDLLTRHPGAPVVFDVKSSQALADDIRAHGGKPIMGKTGHAHPTPGRPWALAGHAPPGPRRGHPGPRRQADHVEDRPFSPQAEDARRRHP